MIWYIFCTVCSISSWILGKLATSWSWEILVYLGASKISRKHLFCKSWILESAPDPDFWQQQRAVRLGPCVDSWRILFGYIDWWLSISGSNNHGRLPCTGICANFKCQCCKMESRLRFSPRGGSKRVWGHANGKFLIQSSLKLVWGHAKGKFLNTERLRHAARYSFTDLALCLSDASVFW